MPKQRRSLACQHCKRLKTRCEVPTDAVTCLRCKNLRLQCVIPRELRAPSSNAAVLETSGDQPCHSCRGSLSNITASLTEVQRTLTSLTNAVASTVPGQSLGGKGAPITQESSGHRHESLSMSDPNTVPVAPIQVVRNMHSWITGQRPDGKSETTSHGNPSRVSLEAPSEGAYIHSFLAASPRYSFIHRELNKRASPVSDLLSATCHLVGSQAWHDYSTQNESLYEEVKKKLSLVMLNPPMDHTDLWTMLILSTWSLGPATSGHFIDSWLLSGSTMLYSLLSYGFSAHSTIGTFDSQYQMTRDRILAWNASALVHLKFSVGTGKPSVFATEILCQFTNTIKEAGECTPYEKASAIELELYADLYQCVVQQVVQIGKTKSQFHAWKLLQRDPTLTFGYISAKLILERWELAQMPPEVLVRSGEEEGDSSRSTIEALTQSIIKCALTVLSNVGSMTSTYGTVPTYDILLGAYAGVTLVQFADLLPDIRGVSELMVQVEQQRRSVWNRGQVLTWASNMMQKKLLDLEDGDPVHPGQDAGQGDTFFQWMPLGVLDTVGNSSTLT